MSLLNDLTVLLECQAHDEVKALFRRQLELLEHAAGEADRLGDELAGAEQRIDDLTAEVEQLRDSRLSAAEMRLALRRQVDADPVLSARRDEVESIAPELSALHPEGWVDSAPGNAVAFEQIVDEFGEVQS